MIQQGQQVGQQAMGIYQQAGAVLGGITNSVQGVPGLETSAAPIVGLPTTNTGLPTSGTSLLGIPVQPLQVAPAINPVPPIPGPQVPAQSVSGQSDPGITVRLGQ